MEGVKPGSLQRRTLLVRGALLGLLPLAACKKGAVTCLPVTLDPVDSRQRAALKYVEKAETSDKECQSCQQYIEPAGGSCGACKLLKGPINPLGSCVAYTTKG